jgi:hypothetical protein
VKKEAQGETEGEAKKESKAQFALIVGGVFVVGGVFHSRVRVSFGS